MSVPSVPALSSLHDHSGSSNGGRRRLTGEPVEFASADALPGSCWSADDPRRTRAWAIANRWPDDGVSFVVSRRARSPVFAAVRRQRDHRGWSMMNAVHICAGLGRGVAQDDAVLSAARREHVAQVNLALAGYTTPVWSDGDSPGVLADFIATVGGLAEREGARPAVLHVEQDSALLAVLAALGWTVGVTDLYPVIRDVGTDLASYVDGLAPKQRRTNVRRDLRRLPEAGGRSEIVVGARIGPYHDAIAALEAATERRHGPGMPVAALRESNEQLLRCFGPDMAVVLVLDSNSDIVASGSLFATGSRILLRSVGFVEERARPFAGYFQAAFYLPLRYAWARGATEILLGPGSLRPKVARGARLRPLFSAVPPESAAAADLLLNTDRAMREEARQLGFPVPPGPGAAR
jgi:hypothetical protein